MRYRPFIEASVNGKAVSSAFYTRLNKATITDAPGQDGDTCELTFDDANNEIEMPQKGASLSIKFGFKDGFAWKMGSFKVEKSTIIGGSDGEFITISGRSADMRQDIKEPLNEHFDETTIGSIVSELAKRHGFKDKTSSEFASIKLPYIARMNQSSADFLTRLADQHDALFSIKDGKFLFLKRGQMPAITINRDQCESWNFTVEPRPKVGKTQAGWFDRTTGKTLFESHSTALKGPIKRLRNTFSSLGEAQSAAQSEANKMMRATGTGSISLAGMPEIMADTPIIIKGFRKEANGLWRAGTVTHTYDDTYKTSISLEADEKGKE